MGWWGSRAGLTCAVHAGVGQEGRRPFKLVAILELPDTLKSTGAWENVPMPLGERRKEGVCRERKSTATVMQAEGFGLRTGLTTKAWHQL